MKPHLARYIDRAKHSVTNSDNGRTMWWKGMGGRTVEDVVEAKIVIGASIEDHVLIHDLMAEAGRKVQLKVGRRIIIQMFVEQVCNQTMFSIP